MSIENSFCLCDWNATVRLWSESKTEDAFAESFFNLDSSNEIAFPERVHYHLASWELLEDFSDWYRGRELSESKDWEHFCAAWKQLGLMEIEEFRFGPVNELVDSEQPEIIFGALSPSAVSNVLEHLKAIDGEALDQFFRSHELAITIPFSELVQEVAKTLDPAKGLIIFAG